MFGGMKVLFAGGISSSRIKIFSKIVISSGGDVLTRTKTSSLFKKQKKILPLDPSLTHIVIENRQITHSDLSNQLECPEIPSHVKLVHCSWIEEFGRLKAPVDSSPYEVDLSENEVETKRIEPEEEIESYGSKRSEIESHEVMTQIKTRRRLNTISCTDLASMTFEGHLESLENNWYLLHNLIDGNSIPSLLFRFSNERRDCHQVIGFDMDGTIITTKSGI
jgi:hypothetical protein